MPTLSLFSAPWIFGLTFVLASAAMHSSGADSDSSSVALQDKKQFTLFNPTPTALMREMNTDRPDTTESPYTVDAGHFQVEVSLLDYQQTFDGGQRMATGSFGQLNFKAGLWHNTDLQVIFDTYDNLRTTGGGITTSVSGFSDVTVRVKTNLWGNDGGTTALALMPYVSIPTQADLGSNRWGGGLVIPLSITFSDRFSLSLMVQADLVPSEVSSGYEVGWIHSASFGIGLTDDLGLYLELVGIATTGGLDYQAFFDTGLTFSATKNLAFDAGIRLGMNHETPDFGVFTGMSIRF